MKKEKDSRDTRGNRRPTKCEFCHEKMYYSDDIKHIPERQIQVHTDYGKNYQAFHVHLRCWQAGLALIKGEVADGIFCGLDNNEQENNKKYCSYPLPPRNRNLLRKGENK